MQHSTSLQLRAVMLICLLGGYEAIRLNERTATQRAEPGEESARDRWSKDNKLCQWKITKGGCVGDDGVGCKYRPLPLDKTLSQSCRLSPSYMVSSNELFEKYLDLQSDFLQEKADHINEHCKVHAKRFSFFRKQRWQCLRQAGHVVQTSIFLSKAKTEMDELAKSSDPVVDKSKHDATNDRIDAALKSLTDVLGEKGQLVMELREAVNANPAAVMKNPEASFKNISAAMVGLFSKSPETRQKAKETIDQMAAEKKEMTTEDIKDIEKTVEALKDQQVEGKAEDALAAIEDVTHAAEDDIVENEEVEATEAVAGSFMEVDNPNGKDDEQWSGGWQWIAICFVIAIIILMVIQLIATLLPAGFAAGAGTFLLLVAALCGVALGVAKLSKVEKGAR